MNWAGCFNSSIDLFKENMGRGLVVDFLGVVIYLQTGFSVEIFVEKERQGLVQEMGFQ